VRKLASNARMKKSLVDIFDVVKRRTYQQMHLLHLGQPEK